MIKRLLLLFICISFHAAAAPEWKLVWSDEFDRDGAPDPAKWGYEVGYIRNGEAQYYTKGNGRGNHMQVPDASTAFHVYAVEWTKEKMRFFVDEKCYFECANDGSGVDSWPFDKPEYLILNLAIGGGWGGQKGIDGKIFPQRMVVDYVRVFGEK